MPAEPPDPTAPKPSTPPGERGSPVVDDIEPAATGFQPIGQDALLAEASLEYWTQLPEESRQTWYKGAHAYFQNLLAEMLVSANSATLNYGRYDDRHSKWRVSLIVLTGTLALVNVLATSWPEKWWPAGVAELPMRPLFSFIAALFAVVLALLTNIESFFNFGDRRFNSRETREQYLNAYREFEMLWMVHVFPYGFEPQACYNFCRLYRHLVARDQELRRKIRQLSETRPAVAAAK